MWRMVEREEEEELQLKILGVFLCGQIDDK